MSVHTLEIVDIILLTRAGFNSLLWMHAYMIGQGIQVTRVRGYSMAVCTGKERCSDHTIIDLLSANFGATELCPKRQEITESWPYHTCGDVRSPS